jgi:protein-S-isoprenylcysteine O-methyltransferase Ste14
MKVFILYSGGSGLKAVFQTIVAGTLLAILLFLAAGRIDWTLGWVFVSLWFGTKIAYLLFIGRQDPALFAERASRHANTKRWDRIIMSLYLLMALLTFGASGLDAVRYNGSTPMPTILVVAGVIVYRLLNLLAVWAMKSNPFHSNETRIQSDRGHKVVKTGPYRHVRHPTYAASVLIWVSTPFILGSWWALIPGGLAGLMMVLRTLLEDRMLHDELVGYTDYVQRVRYRLLPGIW